MRLKTTLPLDKSTAIIAEARRLAREANLLPLTIVVLEAGGRLVAAESEDGSGILRFDIALGKAWGALGMGISSRQVRDRLSKRPTFQNALSGASDGRFIPVPGGVLIEDDASDTIGAVGISGDTSEKDEYCAVGGIRAAGLMSNPPEPVPDWQGSSLSDAGH